MLRIFALAGSAECGLANPASSSLTVTNMGLVFDNSNDEIVVWNMLRSRKWRLIFVVVAYNQWHARCGSRSDQAGTNWLAPSRTCSIFLITAVRSAPTDSLTSSPSSPS